MAASFLEESVPSLDLDDPNPPPTSSSKESASRPTNTSASAAQQQNNDDISSPAPSTNDRRGESEKEKKSADKKSKSRQDSRQSGNDGKKAADTIPSGAGEEAAGAATREEEEEDDEAKRNRPKVQIDPSKDLWQNIALNVKEGDTEAAEMNVLVVGASESGKTTLLQRMYSTFASTTAGGSTTRGKSSGGSGAAASVKKVKPTTALDYSFARRTDRHQAQVAHFWELAQGVDLSQLADVVLTPENIHSMVLVVVVDASDSGVKKIWETATYWLKRLDRRVSEIFSRMRAKGSTVPDTLLHRAHQVLGGADNPDIKRMRISGVPTVLVVNKMDAFTGDSSKLKLLGQCLRFLAHLYGVHLICTGEDESVAKWRLLLSHLLFQAPFDTRHIQIDPERGNMLVMPDKESFVEIGDPPITNFSTVQRGATSGDGDLDRWGAPFDAAFPPDRQSAIGSEDRRQDEFMKKLYELSEDGFGEPKIDAMRRQKEEELEQYRKSMKTKERNASRKG